LQEKKKNGSHEVAGVNASVFEVLCSSVCDDNIAYGDADVLDDDQRSPVVMPDNKITKLSSKTEVNMQMSEAQLFPKALKVLSDANIGSAIQEHRST
jgi:hypothetical protein